jgi:hypothetical protein
MIEARMPLAAIIVVAILIGIPAVAVGQDSDSRNVDQYTCKDVMRESDASRTTAIAFLHGFLLGKSGSSTFNLDAMAKQTDSFIDHCLDNPNEKAVSVMMRFK